MVRRIPFAVAVTVVTVLLLAPLSGPADAPQASDKVVHVVLFLVLTWTLRLAGVRGSTAALAMVAYACATEALQGLLPWGGRSAGFGDLLADVVGILVGRALPVPALSRPDRRTP